MRYSGTVSPILSDKEKILEKVLRYNVDLVEKSENLSQQMIVQKQKSTMRPSVEIEVGEE